METTNELEKITIDGDTFVIANVGASRPHTPVELDLLRDDIRKNGVHVDVLVDENDHVIDGATRLRIAHEIGISLDKIPIKVMEGLTAQQKAEMSWRLNEHRRQLSPADLQAAREKRIERVAKKRTEGKSIRAIAEEEGVSPKTVHQDLEKATVTGVTVEPEGGKVNGRDGKERPARVKKPKPTATPEPAAETPAEATETLPVADIAPLLPFPASNDDAPEEELAALKAAAIAGHEACQAEMRGALEHFRSAGEALILVKRQCEEEGKGWLAWLEENITFDSQRADEYMRLAGGWSKLPADRGFTFEQALFIIDAEDAAAALAIIDGDDDEDTSAELQPAQTTAEDDPDAKGFTFKISLCHPHHPREEEYPGGLRWNPEPHAAVTKLEIEARAGSAAKLARVLQEVAGAVHRLGQPECQMVLNVDVELLTFEGHHYGMYRRERSYCIIPHQQRTCLGFGDREKLSEQINQLATELYSKTLAQSDIVEKANKEEEEKNKKKEERRQKKKEREAKKTAAADAD